MRLEQYLVVQYESVSFEVTTKTLTMRERNSKIVYTPVADRSR